MFHKLSRFCLVVGVGEMGGGWGGGEGIFPTKKNSNFS